ncbi:DNA topoisomerase III [Escherichia coli]|nr:DNA topoisomerase III [Escherichia coli]EFJ1870136.1 DNA topoisomerase III [Escherichia coli]EIR9220776.1 DNA topoisomerase III [Escherichia coli]
MQLFLCEKPSQAKDIARELALSKRGDGYIGDDNIAVTWAIGHLLELAEPEAYGEQFGSPWRSDVLPLIPEQWQMVVKPKVKKQLIVIRGLLKRASEVVIATDADREGEVIARELLEYCQYRGRVRRLWLSALDEVSIRKALNNILPGEQTALLSEAGKGRARADWLTGMNLTRLYTLKARERGISGVLSVGRVQTPTLAMVIRRDQEIATFVPVPWWQVIVWLEKDGLRFRSNWVAAEQYCDDEGRCVNVQAAGAVLGLCRQQSSAVVQDVVQKREKTPPPLCFSLGTLQEACSRKFGMGAQTVLDIAQSLYETHKATTYPRTDCGYLPASMHEESSEVLEAVGRSDPSVLPQLAELESGRVSRIWNDKKITAHHAIIPTRQVFDLSSLNGDELKVYQLIRQHYLAQFLPEQEADVTEATFVIGGQLFRSRGRVNVIIGWKQLFPPENHADEEKPDSDESGNILPPLIKGELCALDGAEQKELKTVPPRPFTEGSLITAMKNASSGVTDPALKKILRENAGLGTEATRAGILETLFARNYIERAGKHIRSTQLGRELVAALPDSLTNPGMTALWEQALDDVARGKISLEAFMEKQHQWIRHLVLSGRNQTVNLSVESGPSCPLCNGPTVKRKGKSGFFWGCSRYPDCRGIAGEQGNSRGRKRKINFSHKQKSGDVGDKLN